MLNSIVQYRQYGDATTAVPDNPDPVTIIAVIAAVFVAERRNRHDFEIFQLAAEAAPTHLAGR